MTVAVSRTQRRLLEKQNAKQSAYLARVPRADWPYELENLTEVWRSKRFLVQVLSEAGGMERMSVCRTSSNGSQWDDQITWEELMQCKREIGRAQRDALEVYPADKDIVNVANMRHLWIPVEPVQFAWRKK